MGQALRPQRPEARHHPDRRRGAAACCEPARPASDRVWRARVLLVVGGGAAWFSSRATWSSSSAMRAAAIFAARLASRLLVRSVALVRSSSSTRARNSSLLGLGAAGEAAAARLGAAAGDLVTLAEVFAVAAAGRPGLRPGVAGFLAGVALAGRAMSLGSFHRPCGRAACRPALHPVFVPATV